ncbi:uncharacterized protein LY79DRAFT_536133 [Colletotrichum navitas]|uniref:Uncharacterized protein n=1 Tax=Colletotrichum navitas TaxID=681940 RepID=A0AAD8QC34_9PEZI|nr:uncharacterized protein LY79DRAFT_536133 [Colletotrichum navitas]KAK1599797.1 hypothetical protein LY79DRAFT_536133 [Colletotrichum navitas]
MLPFPRTLRLPFFFFFPSQNSLGGFPGGGVETNGDDGTALGQTLFVRSSVLLGDAFFSSSLVYNQDQSCRVKDRVPPARGPDARRSHHCVVSPVGGCASLPHVTTRLTALTTKAPLQPGID